MWSLCLIVLSAFASASAQAQQPVDVFVVADTAKLLKTYQNNPPSRNHLYPTHLPANGTNFIYMIATESKVISGQATANLTIKARVGEPISFTGMSESGNLRDAILVYNITKVSGMDIITKANINLIQKGSVEPKRDSPFPDVNLNAEHRFWPLDVSIKRRGAALFSVRFGVYNREEYAPGTQKLFGYFDVLTTLIVPL